MSQLELLRLVVATLDMAGVDYMVTGSLASSLQGAPRASHDIDIVVALTAPGAKALLEAFRPPDYYLDDDAVRTALESTGANRQFNLLDPASGNKVDFWILSDEPFDRTRFGRKYLDDMSGFAVKVSRPEDTILMKLRWAEMSGGSEKQFGDALRVYELQYANLDMAYMEGWARRLRVGALWDQLKLHAKVVEG